MSLEVYRQSNKIQSVKIYPKPKAGTYYTSSGKLTLFKISILAYKYDKTALIIDSNTILQSRPLDAKTKLPLVYQDDNIWLPREAL